MPEIRTRFATSKKCYRVYRGDELSFLLHCGEQRTRNDGRAVYGRGTTVTEKTGCSCRTVTGSLK